MISLKRKWKSSWSYNINSKSDPKDQPDIHVRFDPKWLKKHNTYLHCHGPNLCKKKVGGSENENSYSNTSIEVNKAAIVFMCHLAKYEPKKLARIIREVPVKGGPYDVTYVVCLERFAGWDWPEYLKKNAAYLVYNVWLNVTSAILNNIANANINYTKCTIRKNARFSLTPSVLDPITAAAHYLDEDGELSVVCI